MKKFRKLLQTGITKDDKLMSHALLVFLRITHTIIHEKRKNQIENLQFPSATEFVLEAVFPL